MTRHERLVYIAGVPCSGKTTLMVSLTDELGWDRLARTDVPVPHDALIDPVRGRFVAAEIGQRRTGGFGGTDMLPASVTRVAASWLQASPYPLVLGEGRRLGTARFVRQATEAGYPVTLAVLDHDDVEAWAAARHRAFPVLTTDPAMTKLWAEGARALPAVLAKTPGVEIVTGHPDDVRDRLREAIADAVA